MVKTPALYTKGRRFEPLLRRFFTPTVVLLSFNKPEKVLWTKAKYYYHYKAVLRLKKNFFLMSDTLTGWHLALFLILPS